MAGQDEKKTGIVGMILPFVLVILIGAGTGFAGFKFVGVPPPPADEKKADPAAKPPAAPASATKEPASGGAHGDAKGANKEEADRQAHEAALLAQQQAARKLELADTNVVPIPSIVANLDNPSTTWIRLEASVAVSKTSTAKPADLANLITPRILAYLKTLKLADLQSASGFEFLSADLNEIAKTASEGQVRSVFLTGFVVE